MISAYRRGPQGLTDAGVAFLAFGGDDPDMATATTLLNSVDSWVGGFTMEGENAGDNAGYALRGIGDVNGDGVPDIGVGATSADPNGSSSGRAYVVFGDPARGAYYSGFTRNPQPGEDVYTTPQGHDIFVEAPGLLENDVDYDQDPLTIVPDTFVSSAGSSVQVFADGSLHFSPPHRLWWGEDVFEYTVEDGQGGEAEGVVRVRGIPSVVPLSLVATGKGGYAVDGAAPFDGTGQALAHAGDADGDGLADLLLGAYEADPTSLDSAGTTYVFYGRSAPKVSPLALSPRTTDAYGEAAFDWSGIAVSGAGDFNGDGLSDFLVGAIGADANGSRSGRTYVVFGNGTRPTGLLGSLDGTNGFSLEGEAADDDSGRSIAAAGDVNGDGLDDILVSAYRADGTEIDAGRIYLIYGTDQAIGSASLELSNVGGTVAGVVLEGEGEGDFAGFALAGGVDLDNDGFDEMVIGAYAADLAGGASGRIYVVYGDDALPSALSLSDVADPMAAPDYGLAIDGELPGDFAGRSLAAAGDLDGDGVDDLLVGAPGASVAGVGTGRVYALLGGASFQPGGGTLSLADVGGTVEGAVFDGEAAQDSAGAAIASLGDLNADGYADFVIGAPFATGEAFGSGRAYVVVGRPDLGTTEAVLLADVATGAGGFAIDGEYSFDAAGHAVAGGGDVDGDGYPDIVVGAHEGGPDQQGRVYVVFGGPYVPVQGVAP